jgi:hypothetical protein
VRSFVIIGACLVTTLAASAAKAQDTFCFHSPGKLNSRDTAQGYTDRTVFLPDMVFPLRVGSAGNNLHAHLNSQIFGYGGSHGLGGDLSDPRNFAGCWQDTFCEGMRNWPMPLCPLHVGHQGDDIRADGPDENKYEALAFNDGYVRLVTKNTTLVLAADDGTECRYLHMDPNSIPADIVGKRVKKGETVLGRVSNWMGGVHRGTSTHLHFDCSQTFDLGSGKSANLHIPLYTSLILAYASAWNYSGLSVQSNKLSTGSTFESP